MEFCDFVHSKCGTKVDSSANEAASADQMLSIRTRGEVHRRLQAELKVFEGIQFKRFWATIEGMDDFECLHWMRENDFPLSRQFTPDAYIIDRENRGVVLFEAVYRNDIGRGKFSLITNFSWALNEDGWDVVLVRSDLLGMRVYSPLAIDIFGGLDEFRGWKNLDWATMRATYGLGEDA